jgi:hypothetical protein
MGSPGFPQAHRSSRRAGGNGRVDLSRDAKLVTTTPLPIRAWKEIPGRHQVQSDPYLPLEKTVIDPRCRRHHH